MTALQMHLSHTHEIQDPCYGTIVLPALVRALMVVPEVQRLNRLPQLGLLPRAYGPRGPGGPHSKYRACHTRLEHCIGVAYLAYLVGQSFQRRGYFSDHDVLLLVLAGLFHDLGHITYCHLGDTMLKDIVPDTANCHEVRSQYMALFLLNKYTHLSVQDRDLIAYMIHPNHIIPGSTVDSTHVHTKRMANFINNVHHGFDVDKMDYVCFRDPHHLGVKSGCIRSLQALDLIFNRSYFDDHHVWRFAQIDHQFLLNLQEQRGLLYKQHYMSMRVRPLDLQFLDIMRVLHARGLIHLETIKSDNIASWMDMTDDWVAQHVMPVVQHASQSYPEDYQLQLILVLLQRFTCDDLRPQYSIVKYIKRPPIFDTGLWPLDQCLPCPPCCLQYSPYNSNDTIIVRRVGFVDSACLDPHCNMTHQCLERPGSPHSFM
jgi:hypothetical protein